MTGAAHDSDGDAPASFTKVGERLVHQGHVVGFWEVEFDSPTGERLRRDVVRHPGAVAVVPMLEDGRVVMVRQFRAALEADLLEIPAGKTDVAGEPPIESARRELAEEVGYEADEWVHLVTFQNSPGFCDEVLDVFLARGLRPVPAAAHGAEEEHMVLVAVSLEEGIELIASGELTDGKSIIGLLLARDHLARA